MLFYLSLPFMFVKFWFVEAPLEILWFFASLNHSFFQLFSLPLLLRTFFKPLKNEYRKGLVGFSIGMGIFVKTILIAVNLLLFLLLLGIEAFMLLIFITIPVATVYILFV